MENMHLLMKMKESKLFWRLRNQLLNELNATHGCVSGSAGASRTPSTANSSASASVTSSNAMTSFSNVRERPSINEIPRLAQQIGIEESLKQLIFNYASKSLKTEPIRND
jgi:hypothetical protein